MNDAIFEQLMSHEVVVSKIELSPTGGEQVVNTWTEQGFVEYDRHRAIDEKNEQITCDAVVFLKNDSHFDPTHDRWNITDVKNDNEMQLKDFAVLDDPRNGKTHHYEISTL